MAYTSIPKDMSKIKSKIALNMSKRQLICFGTAAAIGIPTYLFTRGTIGNSPAVLLMMVLMAPLFLLAMYEKDGQPAEKVMRNYIRARFYWPQLRHYKSENYYKTLLRKDEVIKIAQNNKRANQTPKPRHSSRQSKSQRR